jgi:hypothetical protein
MYARNGNAATTMSLLYQVCAPKATKAFFIVTQVSRAIRAYEEKMEQRRQQILGN